MSWFVNPWMLAGGAAVASPIVVHFFFKARFRRLPWAAMRFLKEAIEQTSRRLKFQEWVLLALRCLLVLLIALAFARPKKDAATQVGRGDTVDAVLVFDTSYTMGAPDGTMDVEENGRKVSRPVTRLDRAKQAALKVLADLPANSSVQVLVCPDRYVEKLSVRGPRTRGEADPVRRVMYDKDEARKAIAEIEPSGLATDFLPGLSAALDAAGRGAAPGKEFYLFSDLQRLGFEQADAIKARCDELRRKGKLVFVRCCDAKSRLSNVAVTDVRPMGIIPQANTRVEFVVRLKNTGTEAVTGLKVGLTVGGDPAATAGPDEPPGQAVAQVDVIPAGQPASVTLGATLPRAGPLLVTARITGDGIPGDNRFDRVILARDTIRVLVIDGTPNPTDVTRSGAHAVNIGLNPQQSPRALIQPEVVSVARANSDPTVLREKDVVVLANVPVQAAAPGPQPKGGQPVVPLSNEFVRRLTEFVRNGGGLLIGLGDKAEWATDPGAGRDDRGAPGKVPAYNRVLGSGGARLLPFDLAADAGGKADSAPAQTPFVVAPGTTARGSILQAFHDAPYGPALAEVTATKRFRLVETGPGSAGGQVLIRFTDGRPFVAARSFGQGDVVLVATALDLRPGDDGAIWTTFAARSKAFVPFLHLTASALSRRKMETPEEPRTAGQSLEWAPRDPDQEYELLKPGRPADSDRRVILGKPELRQGGWTGGWAFGHLVQVAAPPRPTGRDAGRATLVTGDTWEPGVYRIVPVGQPEAPSPLFVFNPDLTEGEKLDPMTDDELRGTTAVVRPDDLDAPPDDEWTKWVLLVALAVLVVESAWAWVCGTSSAGLGGAARVLFRVVGVGLAALGVLFLVWGGSVLATGFSAGETTTAGVMGLLGAAAYLWLIGLVAAAAGVGMVWVVGRELTGPEPSAIGSEGLGERGA